MAPVHRHTLETGKGRLAVMNKIDGLWNNLKDQKEIDKGLNRQIKTSAELLGLKMDQDIPSLPPKGLAGQGEQG